MEGERTSVSPLCDLHFTCAPGRTRTGDPLLRGIRVAPASAQVRLHVSAGARAVWRAHGAAGGVQARGVQAGLGSLADGSTDPRACYVPVAGTQTQSPMPAGSSVDAQLLGRRRRQPAGSHSFAAGCRTRLPARPATSRLATYHDGVVHLAMEIEEVIDTITALLDADDDSTVNTSMRIPSALRDAASLAVDHLGVASSTTALTSDVLRSAIETAVMAAALEAHYRRAPDARPTLAETALALAAQDGSPLAARRELVERAAADVLARRPDADADDVLLWAEAQQAVGA